MPEPATAWNRRGAFDGIVAPGRYGSADGPAGCRIGLVAQPVMATIIARSGAEAELGAALAARIGMTPPREPRVAAGPDGVTLIWAGPAQWLYVGREERAIDGLADALGARAAVSRQGDGRAVLSLSGPRARDALAKGCPIDLHPRAFPAGSAALTAIGHIGVHLWLDEDAERFHLAVMRSMAASFWRWLAAAAAEYGYEVSAEAA